MNEILTTGNSAKLYCLNWIENLILKRREKDFKILDLSCGTALNFVNLLKKYPWVYYVGVDPDKKACLKARENLKGLNATIINDYAYNIHQKIKEKFDVIVSFSVLEHVYRRKDYLISAKKCLKNDGYFLINYDAGYFIYGNYREKIGILIGKILARFGIEKYYASFVKEKEFLRLIDEVGFKVVEAKYFNAPCLEELCKVISKFMKKWLKFELWSNALDIKYSDSLA